MSKKGSIKQACRLCIETVEENLLTEIFQEGGNVPDQIFEFTSISITPEDNLPTKICRGCQSLLFIFHEFRKTCLKANQMISESSNYLKSSDWLNENHTTTLRDLGNRIMLHRRDVDKLYNAQPELPSEPQIKIEVEDTFEYEDSIEQSNEQYEANENEQKIETPKKKYVNKVDHSKRKTNYNRKPQPKKKNKPAPPVFCHICGKQYSKRRLPNHINEHLNIRPFVCEVEGCGKTFTGQRDLESHHQYLHTGRVAGICTICGKKFNRATTLALHMSYHVAPTIPCTVCGKLLRNKVSVKQHMIVHQTDKPHTCEVCNKSFAVAKTLRIHMRIHTNERPFPCTMCDMKFAYNCLLKNHKEKYHT